MSEEKINHTLILIVGIIEITSVIMFAVRDFIVANNPLFTYQSNYGFIIYVLFAVLFCFFATLSVSIVGSIIGGIIGFIIDDVKHSVNGGIFGAITGFLTGNLIVMFLPIEGVTWYANLLLLFFSLLGGWILPKFYKKDLSKLKENTISQSL